MNNQTGCLANLMLRGNCSLQILNKVKIFFDIFFEKILVESLVYRLVLSATAFEPEYKYFAVEIGVLGEIFEVKSSISQNQW